MKPVSIILAAGQGKRFRSRRSKVLHSAGGVPILEHVLRASREAGCERHFVVIGALGTLGDQVRGAITFPGVVFVEQPQQLGTGDALRCAIRAAAVEDGDALALVLCGDAPLLRGASMRRLLEQAVTGWGAVAIAQVEPPGQLGRVIRTDGGQLQRIVEYADASDLERDIAWVNSGAYALPLGGIGPFLDRLQPRNAQGELYLTDAVVAASREHPVRCVELDDSREAWGINDRRDLARAHRELVARKVDSLLVGGVTLLDPLHVEIDLDVEVGADCVIHAGVALLGQTHIGIGCEIQQGAWLRDAELGEDVEVRPYSVVDGARIADGCLVGPFSRLRPGTELGEGVHIGNFVEVKKSVLGAGTKANHLAYLGDATVGAGANIGAGVITCNYDGETKHSTEIGEGAFIGSDTMLVAPVKVGAGAITGAGSVVTEDVPAGALGLARARQRNLLGWSKGQGKARQEPVSSAAADEDDS